MIIIIVSTICFVGYAVVCFEQRSVLFLVAASFCIFVFVVDDRQWNRVGERERDRERERGWKRSVQEKKKKCHQPPRKWLQISDDFSLLAVCLLLVAAAGAGNK